MEIDDRGIVFQCRHCGTRNRLAYERLDEAFRCGNCRGHLEFPGEPLEIGGEETFTALTSKSSLPVLVDFWAEWCGPCKMVAPELARVAVEGRHHWLVAKVNTELLPAVAQQFRISSIPTFILFQLGRETARQSGALPAAAIRHFVQQNSLKMHESFH